MLGLLLSVVALVLVDRACVGLTSARPVANDRPAPRQSPVGALAAGACVSLAPTGRARGRTVFLDPGHGGPDPGVVAGTSSHATIREAATALAVAQEVARLLRADGYRVVLSRTRDSTVAGFSSGQVAGGLTAEQVREDLATRARCANASGASALLSIHFNGYGDASARGAQTIYDGARPFAAESRRLAEAVQAAVVSGLGVGDRGVVTDDTLEAPTLTQEGGSYGHLLLLGPPSPGWLDEPTTMPGALVEPLFLTSPADAGLVASAAGQRRVAGSLAAGVRRYLTQ